jgi:hypothetical protein
MLSRSSSISWTCTHTAHRTQSVQAARASNGKEATSSHLGDDTVHFFVFCRERCYGSLELCDTITIATRPHRANADLDVAVVHLADSDGTAREAVHLKCQREKLSVQGSCLGLVTGPVPGAPGAPLPWTAPRELQVQEKSQVGDAASRGAASCEAAQRGGHARHRFNCTRSWG